MIDQKIYEYNKSNILKSQKPLQSYATQGKVGATHEPARFWLVYGTDQIGLKFTHTRCLSHWAKASCKACQSAFPSSHQSRSSKGEAEGSPPDLCWGEQSQDRKQAPLLMSCCCICSIHSLLHDRYGGTFRRKSPNVGSQHVGSVPDGQQFFRQQVGYGKTLSVFSRSSLLCWLLFSLLSWWLLPPNVYLRLSIGLRKQLPTSGDFKKYKWVGSPCRRSGSYSNRFLGLLEDISLFAIPAKGLTIMQNDI